MKPTKSTIAKTAKKQPAAKPSPAPSSPARALKIESRAAQSVKSSRKPQAPKPAAPEKTAKSPMKQGATMLAAKVDVGFGNTLYIRGQGLGLTWDKGFPLNCLDSSTWVWSPNGGNGKAEFKLLINDQIWSQGENLSLTPGERIEIAPKF